MPSNRNIRNYAALALAVLTVSACSSSPTVKRSTPAQIEIQDAVGFTIVEEARIENDVRLDYDTAVSYLESGDLVRGISVLEAVTEAAPNLSAPRIDLGIAYHRLDDLEAAEKHLRLALESNPDHPMALNELGIILRKTGRFAEAKQSYEAALAVYPGFHYARRNLAVLCDLYLADLDCALRNYEAYMATVPSDEEASIWIADIRNRMGRAE